MRTRTRQIGTACAAAFLLLLGFAGSAASAILVHVPGVKGDSQIPGYEGWFVADSFSFGVEREMKESGEKGGTADINIGVGMLQECTISKSLDSASATLAQFAMNGNSPGTIEIAFVQSTEKPVVAYLRYKLDRAFIKSWSTFAGADDRPTEEVAFYYNKIAFAYATTTDGRSYTQVGSAGWDLSTSVKWTGDGLSTGK